MDKNNKVFHGAIALVKVDGVVIGKMRSIQATENFTRQEVRGLGTILPGEAPVTSWNGTVSCEFMSIDFTREGVRNAIKRNLPNIASRVFEGESSFEDQVVLDSDRGVQLDIFKKIEDIFENGVIKPKAVPYAIISRCLITSDGMNVSEGSLASHSQSFQYLDPIMELV